MKTPVVVTSTRTPAANSMTKTLPAGAIKRLVIAIAVLWNGGGSGDPSISGSISGAFVKSAGVVLVDNASSAFLFYKENVGPLSEVITLDPPGASSDMDLTLLSIDDGGKQDVVATNSGTSNTPNVSIGPLQTADEIIVAVTMSGLDTTIAPDASYTQVDESETATGGSSFNIQYRIVNSMASDQADWTYGTSREWKTIAAAFLNNSPAILQVRTGSHPKVAIRGRVQ